MATSNTSQARRSIQTGSFTSANTTTRRWIRTVKTIGGRPCCPSTPGNVGQIGGHVESLVEHEIEAEDLMVDDIMVEIVPEDVEVNPAVYDLPYVDLPLNVFECDGSLWADIPMENGHVGEKFPKFLYKYLDFARVVQAFIS